jgi:hypothetical protein
MLKLSNFAGVGTIRLRMPLTVPNNAAYELLRPESPSTPAIASEIVSMSSPILNHAAYNPLRPESLDHVAENSETITLGSEIQQEASNSPHNEAPALTPAAWGIGWQCPVMMVGFMISGALLALGHHLYYRTLDGTRVTSIESQTWATRIGTGLAFLSRAFLVAAVGIAAAQETWATLRNISIRLHGINSMFDVLNSPMAFFSWVLWRHAKTLTVVAICSWYVQFSNFFLTWYNLSPSSQAHPHYSGYHPRHPVC